MATRTRTTTSRNVAAELCFLSRALKAPALKGATPLSLIGLQRQPTLAVGCPAVPSVSSQCTCAAVPHPCAHGRGTGDRRLGLRAVSPLRPAR